LNTQEAITKPGLTVHPYPQYRPDPDASECHLFGAHEGAIRSTKFGSDDEVIEEVQDKIQTGTRRGQML